MNAKEMYIEWSRRIQLISPDLIVSEKPTSDTAFAMLNAAQDRYVILNFVGDDDNMIETHTFNKNVDSIKSLLVEKQLTASGTTELGFKKFLLPTATNEEYFLYVHSVSNVNGTYKQYPNERVVDNTLIKSQDLSKYATTAFNRPIIRNLAAALMSDAAKLNYLVVACDDYTTINSIVLTYYRRPLRFNTISGTNILSKCELPEALHSEIIDMAVEMFITENKFRLTTKENTGS